MSVKKVFNNNIIKVIKFVFFLFIIVKACLLVNNPKLIFWLLIEFSCICLMSSFIYGRNRGVGYIINFVLLLIFGIQVIVLRFGGTYVLPIMITNLDSIQDIKGKSSIYIFYAVLLVLMLFVAPISFEKLKKNIKRGLSIFLACCLIVECFFVYTSDNSPLKSTVELVVDLYKGNKSYQEIQNSKKIDDEEFNELFYRDGIDDCIKSPFESKPNIVLIFTEGLSQSVIDDDRDIMPNVKEYESKSINFTNYYNHTAATYRGLIGQLYSGYQYNNYDENPLVSIQQILKDKGYETSFINVEPNNSDFSDYLGRLGFDEVITSESNSEMLDNEAYSYLTDVINEKVEHEEPQFIVIYTFGTHASFDSDEYKFNDGSNRELNKFYNADYCFGEFMNVIESDDKFDNTLICYTADHSTYEDEDFIGAFEPEYTRADWFCDRIPFFMYYKGIESRTIDVNGRNSLSLAPTILDYIDIGDENYFLGKSLFSEYDEEYLLDKIYSISDTNYFKSTFNGNIEDLSEEDEQRVTELVYKYFSHTISCTEE